MTKIMNTRIAESIKLISPGEIREQVPASEKATETIASGRESFVKILNGEDKRMVVIVGPCSIHDPKAALEYAEKLKKLADELQDKLFIMMRVYFEKPRTTVGWKGLISDPHLDDTGDMEEGLRMARKLLIDINEMGLPCATELLDPIIAAYMAELVSWAAIGARTTESQTHRQMASGISAPLGFKNNSDGNLNVAINAMLSAQSPHSFLGIDDENNTCILKTKGNADVHIILRGGNGRPNYHLEDIEECEKKLEAAGFTPRIMVDCSHENSGKDHSKQRIVIRDLSFQKEHGNQSIFGVMLESNLSEGKQGIPSDLSELQYGVSVTDACIGWEETEKLLKDLCNAL